MSITFDLKFNEGYSVFLQRDNLIEWLRDNNISYEFVFSGVRPSTVPTGIIIYNEEDAMLVRLRF